MADNDFNEVWKNQPTKAEMEEETSIVVVSDRCIYVNNHRSVGGKPYYSENLPQRDWPCKMRDLLDAFSVEDMRNYIEEKQAREKYFSDYRSRRANS